MVERFQMKTEHDWVCARPDPKGDWVRFSDYHTLRAELEQVKRERDGFRDIAARKSDQVAALIKAEAAERLAGARVKVKALGDWRRGYCDDEVTIEQVPTGFGSIYQVRIFEGKIWLDYPVREKEAFPTVEAAKAAAQADYERRILSTLAEPAGEFDKIVSDSSEFVASLSDSMRATGRSVFNTSKPAGEAEPVAWLYDWTDDNGTVQTEASTQKIASVNFKEVRNVRPLYTTPPDASAIREALEQFADPDNWVVNGRFDPHSGNFDAISFARAALAGSAE